ncbi:predicted protein [Lichtheimia corymbifera JMRC:FSU:9682]|uniref:Pentacotripeptide-repeat region of PRORP domain-containing protein n=1 Tax=Lichtheimia corymbifera JMRC:FSU:9682 TaxID=1263082 RepID=A0A068RLB4_9FUNG|nr:predicted protein [Lichtheimia corymbifera JMRC:FSU:9682]
MFLASAQVLCRNCLYRRFPVSAITTTARKARFSVVDLTLSRATIRTTTTTTTTTRPSRPSLSSNNTFRIPNLYHRRTLIIQSGTAQQQQQHTSSTEPVQQLRLKLYKRTSSPPSSSSSTSNPKKRGKQQQRVRNTIARRIKRRRIVELYQVIREDPLLLEQLSSDDVRAMLSILIPHPDDEDTTLAFQVMDDLVARRADLFSHKEFEPLIRLYVDNGQVDKAETMVQQWMDDGHVPSEDAMATLVAGLARDGRMTHAEGWLKEMQVRGYTTTNALVGRAMIEGWIKLDDWIKADETSQRFWDMDVIAALDYCGKQCVDEWRLAEATRFLRYKLQNGIEGTSLASRIITKCLYTFRMKTAADLLLDTCKYNDLDAARVVTKKLLDYYIQRKDMKHAMWVWETTRDLPAVVSEEQHAKLMSAFAASNYHEHLMKLYRHVAPRYPGVLSVDVYNSCLRSFINAKAFDYALEVFSDMKSHIPTDAMTRNTFYAMYSLCAQTGRVKMFRELLVMAGEIDMELDYKTMNAVMACYLVADDVGSAMQVFETITSTHGPDCVDYNLLMRATAINEGESVDLSKLLKVLQYMNKLNIEPDRTTFRTLLTIYRGADIEKQLFDQLLQDQYATREDEIFLNNMALTRIVENQGPAKAAKILMKNDRRHLFPSVPEDTPIHANGLTYKLIMDALVKSPRGAHIANRIYLDIKSRGWLPYRPVYEALIICWARKGRLQRARRIMQDMEQDLHIKPDVKIYTMLVDGLLAHNHTHHIQDLLSEMQQQGLQLDDTLLARLKKHGLDNNIIEQYNKVS